MKHRAIIVCGSRAWEDHQSIHDVLVTLIRGRKKKQRIIVIHGDAEGADRIGASYAEGMKATAVIAMPAQWHEHGKSAGPLRNSEMLKVLLALGACGYEIAVYAFPLPQSGGTLGMMAMAEEAGVRVHDHGRRQG